MVYEVNVFEDVEIIGLVELMDGEEGWFSEVVMRVGMVEERIRGDTRS